MEPVSIFLLKKLSISPNAQVYYWVKSNHKQEKKKKQKQKQKKTSVMWVNRLTG